MDFRLHFLLAEINESRNQQLRSESGDLTILGTDPFVEEFGLRLADASIFIRSCRSKPQLQLHLAQ
jgi:hypothetical protein